MKTYTDDNKLHYLRTLNYLCMHYIVCDTNLPKDLYRNKIWFSNAHFKQTEEQDQSETLEDPTNLRCRKCRRCLIDSTSLLKVGEL